MLLKPIFTDPAAQCFTISIKHGQVIIGHQLQAKVFNISFKCLKCYLFYIFFSWKFTKIEDLVYFTTQVPDTSDTNVTLVWHEFNINDTSATQVRNFDFDNDTSENIFSQPYTSYMTNERLQWEEQWEWRRKMREKIQEEEMTRSHAKMCLKSAPRKLNFVMAQAYQKVIY